MCWIATLPLAGKTLKVFFMASTEKPKPEDVVLPEMRDLTLEEIRSLRDMTAAMDQMFEDGTWQQQTP
jgi:hypothetical protein